MESRFTRLSIEKAVDLFREWGFRVEDGPGRKEVTVILERQDYRSFYVYEVAQLPQVAAAALRVREQASAANAPQWLARQYKAAVH